MAQARTDLHASREGVAPRPGIVARAAQLLMHQALQGLQGGTLELTDSEGRHTFGKGEGLHAAAFIQDPRTYTLGALRGEVGLGEAYVEGAWTSPDPVAVVRLALRNMAALDHGAGPLAWLGKSLTRLRHLGRNNTRAGSKRNIAAHYDLGNPFYRLWLDETMAYSSGFFLTADATLEAAQIAKYDRICRRLRLSAEDHLLEIGTGWGGFAIHAARTAGCRITTTTLSQEQFDLATERIRKAGLEERITVLLLDYRDLTGTYDKAVSIEMFEAVGHKHYDTYFAVVDRLLKPGGSFLLQTITMNERRFPEYIRSTDWIQQYVFPGAELASLAEIHRSLARATTMGVFFCEDFGQHYARTLQAWRQRFHTGIDDVQALGYDARFQRLWDYYLATCEGAFRERHIGVVQMLIAKQQTDRPLLDEPWGNP